MNRAEEGRAFPEMLLDKEGIEIFKDWMHEEK
jgi:hypothetical protein